MIPHLEPHVQDEKPKSTAAISEVDRLSVNQLARREKLHVSTIWRWMLHGVRGIKLRSIRLGGRRYVTETNWLEFTTAINADLVDIPATPAPAPSVVLKRSERARHELDKLLGNNASQQQQNHK